VVRTRTPACRGGFSLVELVVVIVIVAIVSAAAVPSLQSTTTTKRAVAARLVQRDLGFAQATAQATATTTWVVFDATEQTYEMLLESTTTPGRAQATAMTDPATGRSHVQALDAGDLLGVSIVSVNFGGGSQIGFDRLGRPLTADATFLSTAGSVTLTGSHVISVEPASGLATVTPGT
jgi:prepilin-type N-terminal cleavage/methylation domain-containing protein